MSRLLLGGLLAIVVCACGGGATPTQRPDTVPGQATTAPAPGQQTQAANPAPAGGSVESIARALAPAGALELSHAAVGNSFSLQLSSPMTADQLQAFWDAKIGSLGLSQTGKFVTGGAITYAFTGPDGGIVASPDGSGNYIIQISVGTS